MFVARIAAEIRLMVLYLNRAAALDDLFIATMSLSLELHSSPAPSLMVRIRYLGFHTETRRNIVKPAGLGTDLENQASRTVFKQQIVEFLRR